jgi:hypothetical protein
MYVFCFGQRIAVQVRSPALERPHGMMARVVTEKRDKPWTASKLLCAFKSRAHSLNDDSTNAQVGALLLEDSVTIQTVSPSIHNLKTNSRCVQP